MIELESAEKNKKKQKQVLITKKKKKGYTKNPFLCYFFLSVFMLHVLYSGCLRHILVALAFCLLDWVHTAFNRLYSLYSLFTFFFLFNLLFLCLLLLCYTLIRGKLSIENYACRKSSEVGLLDHILV